jgi:ubiquinone/menaquinone biosynthesis C-methylase UbiE
LCITLDLYEYLPIIKKGLSMSIAVTSKDLFWAQVVNTSTTYSPDSAVIVQGKRIAENAKSMQMEMFSGCTEPDCFSQRLFSSPPKRILDLGAGIGANTLLMAKSGAHVTAIDQSRDLLTAFSKKSVTIGCPSENLRLRRGDITTMQSYEGPFNLVVAIDILPYVPPTTLCSTMEKIQQCLEDSGALIGTIFTTDDPPVVREFMGQLGAHFYENGSGFVTQLLEHSGFTVLELEARREGGFRFKAEKIPVEKK